MIFIPKTKKKGKYTKSLKNMNNILGYRISPCRCACCARSYHVYCTCCCASSPKLSWQPDSICFDVFCRPRFFGTVSGWCFSKRVSSSFVAHEFIFTMRSYARSYISLVHDASQKVLSSDSLLTGRRATEHHVAKVATKSRISRIIRSTENFTGSSPFPSL